MDHEIIAMWVRAVGSAVGVGGIVWALFSIQVAGARRDREIDAMAAAFRKQGEAFDRLGEAMTQSLERQGQALKRATPHVRQKGGPHSGG